mgnify:FL=1
MISGNIRLFATDLDGTLLGRPESTWRFTQVWESIPRDRRPLLVYNTGRTVADTRSLVAARRLPEPDYVIGSIGTELHAAIPEVTKDFHAQFGAAWDIGALTKSSGRFPACGVSPRNSRIHSNRAGSGCVRGAMNLTS